MTTKKPEPGQMAEEYDFSRGRRGRFAKLLEQGYDVVIDGHADRPRNVSAEEVRASGALLKTARRMRRVAERG